MKFDVGFFLFLNVLAYLYFFLFFVDLEANPLGWRLGVQVPFFLFVFLSFFKSLTFPVKSKKIRS